MRVLFDHNLPKRLRIYVPGHNISTTRQMGWESLGNGLLLRAAGAAGFEVFISVDKNIENEQNLKLLPLPVVVMDAPANALPALIPFAPMLIELLRSPLDRFLYIIEPTGLVHRLSAPRRR